MDLCTPAGQGKRGRDENQKSGKCSSWSSQLMGSGSKVSVVSSREGQLIQGLYREQSLSLVGLNFLRVKLR